MESIGLDGLDRGASGRRTTRLCYAECTVLSVWTVVYRVSGVVRGTDPSKNRRKSSFSPRLVGCVSNQMGSRLRVRALPQTRVDQQRSNWHKCTTTRRTLATLVGSMGADTINVSRELHSPGGQHAIRQGPGAAVSKIVKKHDLGASSPLSNIPVATPRHHLLVCMAVHLSRMDSYSWFHTHSSQPLTHALNTTPQAQVNIVYCWKSRNITRRDLDITPPTCVRKAPWHHTRRPAPSLRWRTS